MPARPADEPPSNELSSKRGWKHTWKWRIGGRVALYVGLPGFLLSALWLVSVRMPGTSHSGPLVPLDSDALALRAELERDLKTLAVDIGERHVGVPRNLARAAHHVESRFVHAGFLHVTGYSYEVGGVVVRNIEVEVDGTTRPNEIVVIGAHYDTVPGTPGADDNATGTAALLALATRFARRRPSRTLKFVAFVNEEPPHFQTADMGSVRYAKAAHERGDEIVAMLSLETIGYFSGEEQSQSYPFPLGWFYPDRGDFIGVVGNIRSRALVHDVVSAFRTHADFPCEGAAAPEALPGVTWSDHWAFWNYGYPAVMITDTAPFRNPGYHEPSDSIETIDRDRLTRVVLGVEKVVERLVGVD